MKRLYSHKTDGGAEYLCTRRVKGTTDEGDLHFAAVRLDGEPELLGAYAALAKRGAKPEPAQKINKALVEALRRAVEATDGTTRDDYDWIGEAVRTLALAEKGG